MNALPLRPELPLGSHKKVIYFCRHAEAIHNVKERQAVEAARLAGETDTERARRAVLQADASLRDAPLSSDGTLQARTSGQALRSLFAASTPSPTKGGGGLQRNTSTTTSPSSSLTQQQQRAPFKSPDVVLVSPLRRALMTATELFYDPHSTEEPPLFLAIEALREKRTGLACDERSYVAELQAEFPHVDFSDVARGLPVVPAGEDNAAVRARGAAFLKDRLAAVPGQYLAVVSHKGWLRELRQTLKAMSEAGSMRADFDVAEWDKTLFGNSEVRVAAFRWQDGELASVVSRSIDNAKLASAAMMGDGFEFAVGPPNTGFSIFLADRTTKVHFISLAEGQHHVAIRQSLRDLEVSGGDGAPVESVLERGPNQAAADHPLYDARLTAKGAQQAAKLRKMLSMRPSGGRPFTAFDLVLVSPLTRACETAKIVFGTSPGTYGGEVIRPPRIVVREECRERFGHLVCDGRRTVTELRSEFPAFDFSEMMANADEWYTDTRETGVEIRERSLRLLEMLAARPERCVAVVTHAEFLRHLFGQFTHTLHEQDRSLLERKSVNCELRSVVLCSHGKAEHRQFSEQPSSTVRVPSSSSMGSLLNYFNEEGEEYE
uniref:Uncharacterized protein n=1 Tax=Amphora coffeiformis TaxID=265554 RepID=A0A7S3P5N3_9STRA|mmetsp:Transcript_2098/g.4556  ORF Transcript_2098/g.4556 Transcript_2098/m.4556 type:complete len:605 (-) Transcript_2098:99-1913(-)